MTGRGRFVTFEGGDGGGKSTQIARLADWLLERGIEAETTREPGGAPGAEEIRRLLVEGPVDRWQPVTEVLLHYAARVEHVARTIEPALAAGCWVLCDRFADSTRVYQGCGHGVDGRVIDAVHAAAVGELAPDLTIVLDVPVQTGLARAGGRTGAEDRYERMDGGFHDRVRQGFLDLAAAEPARCVVIDATGEIEAVHAAVVAAARARFAELTS